jgi:hypothetical protein
VLELELPPLLALLPPVGLLQEEEEGNKLR